MTRTASVDQSQMTQYEAPSHMQSRINNRRTNGQKVPLDDRTRQKILVTTTKKDFLTDKLQEKKTMQSTIQQMKTQINQTQKQTRQLLNCNKKMEDETQELEKAIKAKETK